MKRLALLLLVALVVAAVSCKDSVDSRSRLEEPVRVGYFIGATPFRAQFFAEPLPEPNGGPSIAGVDIGPNQAVPGKQNKGGYSVRLAKEAYAVAVRLKGRDNGYWIARVDQPEALFADQVSAALFFDIGLNVTPGTYELELSGVDGERRYGARTTAPLAVVPRIPPNPPVLIKLRWSPAVDLDLQLRAPDGTLLSPKHPTTAPPGSVDAGAGTPPGAAQRDIDSVASCVDDGLREENVFFTTPPTPGRYTIYVNAFSLCGQPGAAYEVSVFRNGVAGERFFGRVSEAEVRAGGFAQGDYIADITF